MYSSYEVPLSPRQKILDPSRNYIKLTLELFTY